MMKKTIVAALASALAFGAGAGWQGLEDANWYAGPKITEADLYNKIVVVFYWSANNEQSTDLIPRLEQIWSSFKTKPLVLVGSHRAAGMKEQALAVVRKNKVTFPVYEKFGHSEAIATGVPQIVIVNHRERIIYSGKDERAATQRLVEAFAEVGKAPTLAGDYLFEKNDPYKGFEKRLTLGSPVDAVIKQLEKDVAAAQKKSNAKNQKVQERASKAQSLLSAINGAKDDILKDIDRGLKINPESAYELATKYAKSFPKDKEFKARLPEMKKQVAEWKEEQKEKARTAKEAAKAAK